MHFFFWSNNSESLFRPSGGGAQHLTPRANKRQKKYTSYCGINQSGKHRRWLDSLHWSFSLQTVCYKDKTAATHHPITSRCNLSHQNSEIPGAQGARGETTRGKLNYFDGFFSFFSLFDPVPWTLPCAETIDRGAVDVSGRLTKAMSSSPTLTQSNLFTFLYVFRWETSW